MCDLEFFRRSPALSGDLRGSPAISGDPQGSPAKWSQEPLVGGPLPTRHGQDDGSLTNSLKLYNVVLYDTLLSYVVPYYTALSFISMHFSK